MNTTQRHRRQLTLIAEVASMTSDLGIELWLRGGWAMDFLIGDVTRVHEDIDFFAWASEDNTIARQMRAHGYAQRAVPDPDQQLDFAKDGEELSFALLARDADDRVVVAGGPSSGAPWPAGMLDGPVCVLEGVGVRVISRESQIEIKEMMPTWIPGRARRSKDRDDVARLRGGVEMDDPLSASDAKRLVRRGYDQISHAYRDDVGVANKGYPLWLRTHLLPRLSSSSRVLDLGCGNGVPATRMLAERFDVTGVDISDVQISRARQLVPEATFLRADMATLEFPPASFDAVVSFFALIHVPLEEQPGLVRRISGWLAPGGVFLATVGHHWWTGTGDFHGAPMYWSHADAATYCAWLTDVGIDPVEREFIAEAPHGGHELILGIRAASLEVPTRAG